MRDKQINVLLVEDDAQSADLVTTAAEMAKVAFKFHFAVNGLEALDFLYQRNVFQSAPRPDLILLDLNLPIVSGHEILAEMKANKSIRHIPVVLLTATDYFEDIKREFDLMEDCCYTKPNRFQDYVRLLSSLESLYRSGRFGFKEALLRR